MADNFLTNILLAPARAAQATGPSLPGILGKIHAAIDPVRAFGGYGGLLAMGLPATASPEALAVLDAKNAAISATRPNMPPPEIPPGAAPNRTDYTLVRHQAPKGDSARFARLEERFKNDPAIADEMKRTALEGADVGRKWYNTEKVRQRFIDVLGEDKGDAAWKEYMWLMGATSTGSKVPMNIKNASYYFVQGQPALRAQADKLMAGDIVPPPGSGYGHKMQVNQAMNVGRMYGGEWGPDTNPTLNPKPRGFAQSLMGSERNIAADKHFMRLMGMTSDDPAFLHSSAEISQELATSLRDKFGKRIDPYIKVASDTTESGTKFTRINFNAKKAANDIPHLYEDIKGNASVWDDQPRPNEYAAFERMAGKMARDLDMTPAQFQASLWMGGARRTGVDPSSLDTFENLFNKRLQVTGEKRGITPEEAFRRFATRKQPLLALPGLLGGGGVAAGLLNQQD